MRPCSLLALGLLLAGCQNKVERPPAGSITGSITYKSKPVNNAMLHLYTDKTKQETFVIPVGEDGTFQATEVPAGTFKIVVEGTPETPLPSTKGMSPEKAAEAKKLLANLQPVKGTIRFPAKYTKVDTTDLTCTISTGDQDLKLVLKD